MERNEQQSSLLRMKPPESQMKAQQHQPPPPPPQNCPRCDSSNTKFCYYNNYSLSQPRYFCKACRRYWTHGGTLRNVPVGGGCRRGKRPKPSIPSSSSSEIGGRTLSSSPAPTSQSLMSMNQGQGFPSFQPVMPSVGNSFYPGGSFLSSLAAMQSLPAEVNQRAAANLGGGNSHYDVDMAVLQGVSRHSLISQPAPHQFQMQNEYFPSHVPPSRPLAQWTQNFINGVPATTSSAASSGFLGGNAANSDIQAGSSFNPNHFPDSNTRIDPQ